MTAFPLKVRRARFSRFGCRGFLRGPLAAAALLTLAACGGGGGGGGGDGAGSANRAPVANAGSSQWVSRTTAVTLDGRASTDADSDPLSYTWTQVHGADVTGGSGALSGAQPSFTAPAGVQTLEFRLVVNDGRTNSSPSSVIVNVLEDRANAIFVDGDTGSDSAGSGAMDSPFATVRRALTAGGSSQADLYLRQRGAGAVYDETSATLEIPSGTSLYGGYGANWQRDVQTRRVALRTDRHGLVYSSLGHDVWVSGLALQAADADDTRQSVHALRVVGNGQARITIEHNSLMAGHAVEATTLDPGSSYGMLLSSLAGAVVFNNTITAGRGGNATSGSNGGVGSQGLNGADGNTTAGRRAPGGSGPGATGGVGGTRGGGVGGSGGGGSVGNNATNPLGGFTLGGIAGAGGAGSSFGGSAGQSGLQGHSADRGRPGSGGLGVGNTSQAAFTLAHGSNGGRGGSGGGGGGGGGGAAGAFGVVGGGGGGGAAGGQGGEGGFGGRGAGASVGLWLHEVPNSEVRSNVITTARGGNGGNGGNGGDGGFGGVGGSGGAGDVVGATSGLRGGPGAAGGRGGRGGMGGGGGGGPSFGVFIASPLAPTLAGNTIEAGNGGVGGDGANGGGGGASFAIYRAEISDGPMPSLNGNTLRFGTGGAGGERIGTDGGGGSAGTAAGSNLPGG